MGRHAGTGRIDDGTRRPESGRPAGAHAVVEPAAPMAPRPTGALPGPSTAAITTTATGRTEHEGTEHERAAPAPARTARDGDAIAPPPRRARGTVAALPPAGPVPGLQAPTLRTAPVAVQRGGRPAARPQPVGRLVALCAALVVAGAVTAQLTAERSVADVPVLGATTSAPGWTGTPEADGATVSASGPGSTADPSASTPDAPSTTPTPAPSAGTPTASGEPSVGAPSGTAPSGAPAGSSPPSASGSASPTPDDPASAPSSSAPAASPAPTSSAPPSSAAPSRSPSPAPTPSTTSSPASGAGAAEAVRSLRAVAAAAGGRDVALGAGSYRFDDFRDDGLGVHVQGDLIGQGSDRTSIQMTRNSSSKQGRVPKKDWSTNQLSLVKVSGAGRIRGFTLRGTDQGHLYNGLRISRSSGTRVSDVRVIAVPGADDIPPGETFGINDFHTDGTRYSGVEVDGSGVSAAAFGTNSSSGTVIEDSWFHDSGHANGATFWQTKDVTVRDTRSTGNHDAAFNFERVSGTVLLDHVTMKGNRLSHLRIDSDRGSAAYRIVDPVFDGPKLKILMTPRYMGAPNLQRRSDVHVIVGGVDRTDEVVQWVTHF